MTTKSNAMVDYWNKYQRLQVCRIKWKIFFHEIKSTCKLWDFISSIISIFWKILTISLLFPSSPDCNFIFFSLMSSMQHDFFHKNVFWNQMFKHLSIIISSNDNTSITLYSDEGYLSLLQIDWLLDHLQGSTITSQDVLSEEITHSIVHGTTLVIRPSALHSMVLKNANLLMRSRSLLVIPS